jgi:hypothetical protein
MGVTGQQRSLLRHLLDLWFSAKHVENEAFYERLGVLFLKRYVPTGGEAIHEIAFLGFLAFSPIRGDGLTTT